MCRVYTAYTQRMCIWSVYIRDLFRTQPREVIAVVGARPMCVWNTGSIIIRKQIVDNITNVLRRAIYVTRIQIKKI